MEKNSRVLLAIDPSINFCGIAIFYGQDLVLHELVKPDKTCETYLEKSRSIYQQVKSLVGQHGVGTIVLEVPEHWAVAGFQARESGSIFKVTFVAGMLYTLRPDVHAVSPRVWKGQLPKNVMANRLAPYYQNFKKLNHNVRDAIGIGHWKLYGKV